MSTLSSNPTHIADWVRNLGWRFEEKTADFENGVERTSLDLMAIESFQEELIDHIKELLEVLPFIATLREQTRAKRYKKAKTRKQ